MLTFLMLKAFPFRESGIIHHKQKQLPQIAKTINVSYPTLMRHISQLKKLGLVQQLSKNTLRLASYNKMLDKLDGTTNKKWNQKKQVYSLEKFAINPLKELQHLFLHEHQKNQRHAIRKKIRAILSESTIKSRAIHKYKRKFNSLIIEDCEKYIQYGLNQEKLSYLLSDSEFNKLKTIDVETCISCFSMANYFNRKSAQTGSKRLRQLDIERNHRMKLVSNKKATLKELDFLKENFNGFFMLINGFLYRKLSSSYQINADVCYRRSSVTGYSMCEN